MSELVLVEVVDRIQIITINRPEVRNAINLATAHALAEAFTMGVKAGIEPLALWEAIRQGAGGRARLFDRMGGKFLTGQYDPPDFALRLRLASPPDGTMPMCRPWETCCSKPGSTW